MGGPNAPNYDVMDNVEVGAVARTVDERKRVRAEMADSRKEQWRAINEIADRVGDAKEASRKALYDMRKSMPRATSQVLNALKQIVASEGLAVRKEYFGLVMENFKLTDDKYRTAVEVAAQNSLFHVIVDAASTAARLMKRLEDGRLGRVTFLQRQRLTSLLEDNLVVRRGELMENGGGSSSRSTSRRSSVGGAKASSAS